MLVVKRGGGGRRREKQTITSKGINVSKEKRNYGLGFTKCSLLTSYVSFTKLQKRMKWFCMKRAK